MDSVKFAVVLTIALAVLVTTASDISDAGFEPEEFTCYGISYRTTTGSTVEVLSASDDGSGILTIPDTVENDGTTYNVTSVAIYGIYQIPTIREAVIGNNVTLLDYGCFSEMDSLEKVTFGTSLSSIGYRCFSESPKLTEIVIPDGCPFIFDGGALYNTAESALCLVLAQTAGEIHIGPMIGKIADFAMYGCTNVTSIVMPESLFYIGMYAFHSCSSLEHVSTYDTVTMTEYADRLPNDLVIINSGAFLGCTSLKSFDFGTEIVYIGDYAFSDCSGLTTVTIPNSVTYIGASAFFNCNGITGFEVTFTNKYAAEDGVLYKVVNENNIAELICFPMGKELPDGVFTIPLGTISIGPTAFTGQGTVKEVVIPDSVNYISPDAFYSCASLEKVNIPAPITYVNIMAFYNCTSLTTVVMHPGVTLLDYACFGGCTSLTSIVFPENLLTIEDYAFEDCTALESVTFPASLVLVGGKAFTGTSLKEITVLGDSTIFESESLDISGGESEFTITVHCRDGFSIPGDAFGSKGSAVYDYFDKERYPYENWVAIAICLAFLFFFIRAIRRV